MSKHQDYKSLYKIAADDAHKVSIELASLHKKLANILNMQTSPDLRLAEISNLVKSPEQLDLEYRALMFEDDDDDKYDREISYVKEALLSVDEDDVVAKCRSIDNASLRILNCTLMAEPAKRDAKIVAANDKCRAMIANIFDKYHVNELDASVKYRTEIAASTCDAKENATSLEKYLSEIALLKAQRTTEEDTAYEGYVNTIREANAVCVDKIIVARTKYRLISDLTASKLAS